MTEHRPNAHPIRRTLEYPRTLPSAAPRSSRALSPSLAAIAALWQAQGGQGLPPLAGGAPARGPSTTSGGSSGASQMGEAPGFDLPRAALQAGQPTRAELERMPNIKEFGAKGDNRTDDTAAINAAIAATANEGPAGPNGGSLYAPPGVYISGGIINANSLTGVHIVGAGGLSGGGAIGVGGGRNIAATVFIYTGEGGRAWDLRSSVACDISHAHCFASNSNFTGPVWDLSGQTELTPSFGGEFNGATAESTAAPGALLPACIGANLDWSVEHTFNRCFFKGCLEGTTGLTNAAHFSVSHHFHSCVWAGNQLKHLANPQEAWALVNPVAESLFNNKGEILNTAGGIGYTKVFKSHGVVVLNPWFGSNVPAARAGVNIEARGEGWVILGGSLNTGEVGVFFPEGPIGSIVAGVRFWKVNSGLTITGKTIRSLLAFNTTTEAIALLTDTIKEYSKSLYESEAGVLTLAP